MTNNLENNYKEWFSKASEDESAGNDIVKAGHFYGPACFHFQQTAEKYLKGLLIFHNKAFPKTHDLIELETLLETIMPDIRNIHQNLKLLNRYYIETRYPGDYPEFTLNETKKAAESAKCVKEFVFDKIIKSKK